MEKFYCDDKVVYYVNENDTILFDKAETGQDVYYRVEVQPFDYEKKTLLRQNNLLLYDRTILLKIQLDKLEEDLERYIRLEIRDDCGFCPEMYDIAKEAFVNDSRFTLSESGGGMSHQMIKNYIDYYSRKSCIVIGCYNKKGDMAGFVIVHKKSEEAGETVLGAVLPKYQKMGGGISLYAGEFSYLKKVGIKTLYSRIATTNTASLNLHVMLGKGQVSMLAPLDIYINRVNEQYIS